MKTMFRILFACAVVAVLAAPVAAQAPLSKRVSLDLKAMAPADAFAALASSAGMKVVVDPAVTAPVDILVRNVTARTALTTMCESIGCEWTLAGGTLSIKPARAQEPGPVRYAVRGQSPAEVNRILDLLKKPLPAGMKFENTPLEQVGERISEALGITIVFSTKDPGLQTVTIDFGQKSLMTGLKELGELVSGEFRLAVRIDKDAAGKGLSPSIMIAIGKPGQVKK